MPPAVDPRPLIINQSTQALGERLRQHHSRPQVLDSPADPPWIIDQCAEVLLLGGATPWRQAPAAPPLGWPHRLRWVQAQSVGIDAYPQWLLGSVLFTLGKGLTAGPIAEYVCAAILRQEQPLNRLAVHSVAEWVAWQPSGLQGKTLGILGYGAVGQAVAIRAKALGMAVQVMRSGPWLDPPVGVTVATCAQQLFADSDHLVLAAPVTPQTLRMVDATLLACARPGLHLINVARGELVDHDALLDALRSGRVGAATLDVTHPEPLPDEHQLYTLNGVLITPHCAWYSPAYEQGLGDRMLENLRRYLAGESLLYTLDLARGY
ncbi:NAD(P)-dependent oxidoreductase [Pseudomonas sp. XS1P51]